MINVLNEGVWTSKNLVLNNVLLQVLNNVLLHGIQRSIFSSTINDIRSRHSAQKRSVWTSIVGAWTNTHQVQNNSLGF